MSSLLVKKRHKAFVVGSLFNKMPSGVSDFSKIKMPTLIDYLSSRTSLSVILPLRLFYRNIISFANSVQTLHWWLSNFFVSLLSRLVSVCRYKSVLVLISNGWFVSLIVVFSWPASINFVFGLELFVRSRIVWCQLNSRFCSFHSCYYHGKYPSRRVWAF